MITRRTLAALLPAAALTACAGQTTAQLAQTVVTDAGLVANALTNVLPNLQGVPPGVADKVASYAQQAVGAAQSLVATMTQAQAQPVIQQIQTDVKAVAAAVQPVRQAGLDCRGHSRRCPGVAARVAAGCWAGAAGRGEAWHQSGHVTREA